MFPAADWVEEIGDEDGSPVKPPAKEGKNRRKKRNIQNEISTFLFSPGNVQQQCVSLYDYEAQDDDELTIMEGEILNIDYEDSGWFFGSNQKGEVGRFPSNFTEILK